MPAQRARMGQGNGGLQSAAKKRVTSRPFSEGHRDTNEIKCRMSKESQND
jgi:hypothetical protein